jgi:hypothetical protein
MSVMRLVSLLRAPGVAIALHGLSSLPKALPVADKAVGALRGIDADFGFKLHGADRALAATISGLTGQRGLALQRAGEVGGAMRADRIERLSGLLKRVALVRQDRQSLFAHLPYVGGCTGITFDRPALIGHASLIGGQRFEPVRPAGGIRRRSTSPVPATAGRFRQCARGR